MSGTVLVFVEHAGGEPERLSLEALAFARGLATQLGAKLDAVLLGSGTEGVAGYSDRIENLENTFKASWLAACPDFQTTRGYGRSRPNSANLALATNWVGQNFGCLAFTIEMPFKDNSDLPDAHLGWSADRSKKLGASVLLPILEVAKILRTSQTFVYAAERR